MRTRRSVVPILVMSVVVGLIAGWFRITTVTTTEAVRPAIRADAAEYYLTAYNLTHNGTYSRSPGQLTNPPQPVVADAYRPPGLPLMIAPFMAQWPNHDRILRSVLNLNVALGVATAVATVLAASTVLPLAAAGVVGLAVAASPHLVSFSVYMLTETPAAFLVALLLAAAALRVPQFSGGARLYFILLGALIGALSLFRPVFLAFAPVAALAFQGRGTRLNALAFICLGAALTVAPWFVRNAVSVPHTPDEASLIATTMLDGSYRGYVWQGNASTFPYPRFADPMFETARRSIAVTLSQVGERIAADPLGMAVWYLVEKTGYLLQWSNVDGTGDVFIYAVARTPFDSDPVFKIVHTVFQAIHWLVVALAGFAAATVWTPLGRFAGPPDRRHLLRLASLLFGYVVLVHIPFFTATRYAVPIYPALYLLAGTAVAVLAAVVRERRQTAIVPAGGGTARP